MKKYSYDNWNQVLELLDGLDRQQQLRLIGSMARSNLHNFVRRLMGRTDDPAYYLFKRDGEVTERSQFLNYMERLDEDNFS
jgi:hypothetical protein